MTDKELKKLNRQELLELLIEQMKENAMLRKEIEDKQAELQKREIKLQNSGNIAEAALQINRVFEVAQAAADQYIQNVRSTAPDSPAPGAVATDSLSNEAEKAALLAKKKELLKRENAIKKIEEEYIFLKSFYKKYKRFADILEQRKKEGS